MRLGNRRATATERVVLLASGASFGTIVTGLLVLAASSGWLLPALALVALLATATLPPRPSVRTWDSRREMIAGWALSIVGIATLSSGLGEIASTLARELAAHGPAIALLLLAVGTSLAMALRSPPAVACVALLAAGANLIDGWSAAVLLVGATLAIPVATVRKALRGSSDERCAAAGHALFCALWALFGLAILLSVSPVRGLLEGAPGGPGVAALAVHALTGILAAPVALLLLGSLERLIRARSDSAPGTSSGLDWHGDPELLHGDLHRALDAAAATARLLIQGGLGHGAMSGKRSEAALAELDATVDAILELQSAQAPLRVPLSLGCGVQAALRSAEAWRELGQWLAQFRPADRLSELALDRRLVQFRMMVARLVEASRVEADDFSLESWRSQMDGVETAVAELRTHAISAWGAGVLPPPQLSAIENEIEWLRALVRTADRAVSEWSSMLGVDAAGNASPALEPEPGFAEAA